MRVQMYQHAVGQGGLFSGQLDASGRPLRWAYDCGSNQPDALARGIRDVQVGGDLDLLFLSHLDSDHANGIDRLLSTIDAHEIVLPYINETILLATIARDSARGTLTGSFVDLASDVAGWFGDRGAATITFINGHGDEDGEGADGPAVLPVPEGRGGDGDAKPKWTREPEPLSSEGADLGPSQSGATMQQVAANASMAFSTPHGVLNWGLIPYVHQPAARLLLAFEQELEARFGSPLDKAELIRTAKNADVRQKLRDCYDALWLDHNLISMTLYCGPLVEAGFHVYIRPRAHWDRHWHQRGGWMLTGDAHLDRDRRRARLLAYYRKFLLMTDVLMLPHHGSIHNHSDALLDALPGLKIGYAAAGPNSYGHPSDLVRDAVDGHGAMFHQVDDHRSNRLFMNVWD